LKKRALLVVLPQSVARMTFIFSGLISGFDGFRDTVNPFSTYDSGFFLKI
jgi:hypothetical protein